ncbi:InlB B-repeat-containing protein, partial [Intestinibacter sp.]
FNDADSFVLTPKLKDSNAKLKMSIDGGEMVDVVSGKALDPIKFGDKKEVEVKLFGCSDATYYANQQAGKEDPFEVQSTYTITVERTNIDSDVLDNVKILSVDISNGTWCTPKFNKDLSSAAILLDEDATSVDLTFRVAEGTKAYSSATISDKYLINPNEDGSYTLNIAATKNGTVKLAYNLEDGSQLVNTYTFITYQKGKLAGMPDSITDYLCPGSQYTNMSSYGMYPEKSMTGSGTWYSPISLGNFGGYVTYYYEKAIKNDPTNPYGIDFTIFGNSNGGQGFSEPGNVIVSKDGENWYTLAGSEHYDEHAIWGYELTYIRNGSTTACSYSDNLGGSADMTSMYKFPLTQNYPLHKFSEDADKQVTVSGTLLVNDTKDPYGSSAAMYPDFGYVDVHRNSSTVGGTGENVDLLTVPVGNPYTGSYDQYGDGFDLDWAVDENGYPVKLDEIHYVKVQTASFIMAGAIGEKSTEVNAVTRTFGENEVGKTTAPTSITVGDKTIELQEGVNTYSVDFPENFDVTVNASENANIYINSQRGATRTYTAAPDKGIIRIIVQEGEKEPVIYYLTNKKVETKTTVTFDADNTTDAVVKEVAEDGTLDYTPENPTKKGYIFVGWYKDVDDTTTGYKSSETYTESTTYKAKWAHVNMLGAQAKSVVDGKSGIRFATKVYKDGDEVVEKGTLIIPTNLLKGQALTLDTAKAAKSIANVDYQQKEDSVVYLGTIVNIPQNQFNREMTATSYIKYRDKSGNEYIVYSPYARGSITINQLLEGFM